MYDEAAAKDLKNFIADQTRPRIYRDSVTGEIAAIHVPSGYVRAFSSIDDMNTLYWLEVIPSNADLSAVDTATMNGLKGEAARARIAIADAVALKVGADPNPTALGELVRATLASALDGVDEKIAAEVLAKVKIPTAAENGAAARAAIVVP